MKKLTALFLSLLLTLNLTGCQNSSDNSHTQAAFDQFIEQEFIDTLENDYISLHTLIENPEAFNIDTNQVTVGLGLGYSDDDLNTAKQITKETYEQFKQFDRNALTILQQETYDIYHRQIENAIKLNDDKYDYLAPAFQSATGIHVQLPTMLTDWTIRNEQDVVDLITLVGDTDTYLQSLLDYALKQAENNTLSINLDEVIDYCSGIVADGASSYILVSLNEKITALNLDANKTADYLQQLQTVFMDSLLAGYQNIIDTLKTIDSNKINHGGLGNLPNGPDYYQSLLQRATGTDQTVAQIQEEIENAMDDCLKQMQSIIIKNPNIQSTIINNFDNIKTNYHSYEEIINDIASKITNDFPDIGTIDYQIEQIDPTLANNSVAAYYNIPAIDSSIPNQIRVNSNNNEIDIQDIDTFQTLVHEGLPGHMYQINYSYQNLDSNYRKVLASNPSYTEGWAVYVQYYCNKYLSSQVNDDILSLLQYNNVYSYYAMILCDIGIHFENWDLTTFKERLNDFGLTINDSEALTSQYYQLRDNPTIFIPYYYGYLQFSNLRQEALEALNDDFNDLEFHQALLKSGVASFEIVSNYVQQYIESKK